MAINTEGKLHFLIDQSFEYERIKFYGTPWINPIDFQENKWAFEIKENNPYSKIPKCDVLITHDSPFENTKLSVNSVKTKCKYHFFGHWHDGFECHLNGKYNCSRLNDYYSFKKSFEFPTINIDTIMEKTKYEILQEFAEEVKNNLIIEDLEDLEKSKNKIDEILVKFLDNPKDNEDEIDWIESSLITDNYEDNGEDVDGEYK